MSDPLEARLNYAKSISHTINSNTECLICRFMEAHPELGIDDVVICKRTDNNTGTTRIWPEQKPKLGTVRL